MAGKKSKGKGKAKEQKLEAGPLPIDRARARFSYGARLAALANKINKALETLFEQDQAKAPLYRVLARLQTPPYCLDQSSLMDATVTQRQIFVGKDTKPIEVAPEDKALFDEFFDSRQGIKKGMGLLLRIEEGTQKPVGKTAISISLKALVGELPDLRFLLGAPLKTLDALQARLASVLRDEGFESNTLTTLPKGLTFATVSKEDLPEAVRDLISLWREALRRIQKVEDDDKLLTYKKNSTAKTAINRDKERMAKAPPRPQVAPRRASGKRGGRQGQGQEKANARDGDAGGGGRARRGAGGPDVARAVQ